MKSLCTAFILCCLLSPLANSAERPNVVVFLSDDQGWGDFSMNGNQRVATPHIDSLARDGASFDRFYVCPVCSPTRAEFLTGRYHVRGGVFSTSAGGERLDLDESTIADTFRAAGYATAAFGKWHNGMQYPYHPCGRGFDAYYGFCSGHWGDYFSPLLEHNGKLIRGEGFVVDDFTNRAMKFIEQHKEQAFFVYLPYNTPHSPMQVPDRWWEKFKPQGDQEVSYAKAHELAALAMCENIDWNVGRLLAKLDELGIADNTIVLYFCDNGPNGARYNGGMRGRKGSTDEGGVRSPLVVRWPAKIKPKTEVKPICAAIDLLPTLAEMCGIEVVSKKPLDGVSNAALLLGEAASGEAHSARLIFSHWNGKVSVRSQRFRLDHTGKLYDMIADPGQKQNVAKDHPEAHRRLQAAVAQWRTDVLSELKREARRFPVGHADFRFTQLPARDAKVTGGLQRSNRFPNCSYFTNWTKTDERLSWDIEVLEPGKYAAEMYYTCPQANVGSTVRLSFQSNSITAKIEKPHDPPVRGAENDRVERRESYVKNFRPLAMGTIQLERGKGTLTLQATDIPGQQVGDFRLLMLTRVGK